MIHLNLEDENDLYKTMLEVFELHDSLCMDTLRERIQLARYLCFILTGKDIINVESNAD